MRGLRWFLCAVILLAAGSEGIPMGLDWNDTDQAINHGSDASVDDVDPVTFILWFKPHVVPGLGTASLVVKNRARPQISMREDKLQVDVTQGTGSPLLYTSNDLPTAGEWSFLVVTIDLDPLGLGEDCHIYLGDLTTVPTEVTYVTQTDFGGGSGLNNAGQNLLVGSDNDAGRNSPDWNVAHFSMWNRVFTLDEIIAQWQWPHLLPDDSALVFTQYIHPEGETPVTQPDWSGKGNHGVPTGGIIIADHVPLPPQLF